MKSLTLKLGLLFAILSLVACNFDFLQNADLGLEENGYVTEEAIPGGIRYKHFTGSDVLKYYEDHYLTDNRCVQIQRYSAQGQLQYTYAFAYDGDGRKSLMAYFDAASQLIWYQTFTYSDTELASITEYKAGEIRQWVRLYDYDNTNPEEPLLTLHAVFNSDLSLAGGFIIGYDAGSPRQKTVYGSMTPTRGLINASSRALLDLDLPALPDPASLPGVPTQAMLEALGISSRTFWFYDEFGTSEIQLDKDWYPLQVSRTDTRIAKTASLQLEWEAGRIKRKKSFYGTTLALDLTLAYTASGLPKTISSRGAALLLPLDYTFTYADTGLPEKIEVSNSGNLLQYFELSYSGDVPDLAGVQQRGIDPFAWNDLLDQAGLTISHYDGDNRLIQSFSAAKVDDTLRIEVRNPDSSLNGYYSLAYDVNGRAASLTAFDASAVRQWSYEYSYAESDLIALTGLDEADFGRLAETWLTDDLVEYAKAFIVDLLF